MIFNKFITAMLSLCISLLFFIGNVYAIEVYPIIKEIKSETPRDNYVTVKSSFNEKKTVTADESSKQQYEFVTLELFEVTNPGAEKEIIEKELRKQEPTLIFSPTRVIIPYGEERKVRLMPLKVVTHEKVYRLRIRPSYPEQELDKGKVRFAIGYDVLLRYLPDGDRTQNISISCDKNNWIVTATGNVRSEMRNLVLDGKKGLINFNVYPNFTRSLTINHTLSFEMDKKIYNYEACKLKG